MHCWYLDLGLLLLYFTHSAFGLGSSRFQCPEGHYLSRFSSAFDGSERFYKFGCSKFQGAWTTLALEEKCESTELASMEMSADAYLSCGSDQYTAGVHIVEASTASGQSSELWQLLCCWSSSITIRAGDCVETKFINDFRRASSFSSAAQVVRRWQTMSEDGDRRWWLQICPVDVNPDQKKPMPVGDVRIRRQVPWEWARSRFAKKPVVHPLYQRRILFQDTQKRAQPHLVLDGKSLNSYTVVGNSRLPVKTETTRSTTTITTTTTSTTTTTAIPQSTTSKMSVAEMEEEEEEDLKKTTPVDMPKLMAQTDNRPAQQLRHSRLMQFQNRRQHQGIDTPTPTSTTSRQKARQPPSSTTQQPVEALDYYDMYDDNFDRAKHVGNGGLLDGVTDFIQSLQDGLTLAQAAFPAHVKFQERNGPNGAKGFHLKIAVPPGGHGQNELAFFKDEEVTKEETDDAEARNNLQIGSFVQQSDSRQMGPWPKQPSTGGKTAEIQKETNTIESMLQMLGLCRHVEL